MKDITAILEAKGLRVWIDQTGISPGTANWRIAIQDAIDCACCFLVIFSPPAKESRWVGEEMSYAEVQKKRMFYILAFGDESTAIPFGYTNVQWVDIRDKSKYDQEIQRLIASICKYLLGVDSPFKRREDEQLAAKEEAKRIAAERARQRRAQKKAQRQAAEEEERERSAPQAALPPTTSTPLVQTQPGVRRKHSLIYPPPTTASLPTQAQLQTAQQPVASPLPGKTRSSPPKSQSRPHSSTTKILTPRNPLNWLRLLWWIFVTPERYVAYKERAGENSLQEIGVWLGSILAWLPLFIFVLGLSLGSLPSRAAPADISFSVWGIILLIQWMIVVWCDSHSKKLGCLYDSVILMFGSAGIAFVVPFIVAGKVEINEMSAVIFAVAFIVMTFITVAMIGADSGLIAGMTSLGGTMGVAGGVCSNIPEPVLYLLTFVVLIVGAIFVMFAITCIENNIKKGRSSWWSKTILATLALSYAVLIWLSFFGGYKFFENL